MINDCDVSRRDLSATEQLAADYYRALKEISRMKAFPDDKINRTTLCAAIEIARQALGDDKP
jgi:hypothetical protein